MSDKLQVLFVAYEAAPFFKRGGLGDYIGSLPKALEEIGVNTKVVIPYYEEIHKSTHTKKIGGFSVRFGSKEERVSVRGAHFPGSKVACYFLGNKRYLFFTNRRARKEKIERFAFFDLAVSHFVKWQYSEKNWKPSVIHCNDWHTALIPLILKDMLKIEIPILLTIHNLIYRGLSSLNILDLLHVQDDESLEVKKGKKITQINLLGQGVVHADRVITVSPSYADEIMHNVRKSDVYAYIKERVLKNKAHSKITGIVNGIDYEVWNPGNDAFLAKTYTKQHWLSGRKDNKEEILKLFSLPDRPTFCFVGRMSPQKGLDVLKKAMPELEKLNINLIVLGTGEKIVETNITNAFKKYQDWAKVEIEFSEELAHKLYAGADFIIIPSHFEPCGLIQMIAMRYGTVPIASKTGGLKDTIDNGKNGFLFRSGSRIQLANKVKKALKIYADKKKYHHMVEKAMDTDFSWHKGAQLYKELYLDMLNKHG